MFDFFFWRKERLPLPYSREIHCHLIPGVDDGSTSMDFTMKAIKFLEKYGVEKLIITPHYTYPKFINTPAKIQPVFDAIKDRVSKAGLEIKCENFSFEYRVDRSFEHMIDEGPLGSLSCQIRPIKGKWILIENAWDTPYDRMDDVIERLKQEGYKVILAHPERYRYYAERPGEFYYSLRERGVYFQCNLLSLAGAYGKMEKEVAHWMLKKGFIQFLGSDIHNSRHLECVERYLKSNEYSENYDRLSDIILNDVMGTER